MNPTGRTSKCCSGSRPTLSTCRQLRDTALRCSFFGLLLLLLNLSQVQKAAEVKCPMEMGWDGLEEVDGTCRTWLSIQYVRSSKADIFDYALLTCYGLPNGYMPLMEEISFNVTFSSVVHPVRLIDGKRQKDNVTLEYFDLEHGKYLTNENIKEADALKKYKFKDLPQCRFSINGSTEFTLGSCHPQEGSTVWVLCSSGRLEHCNPKDGRCDCDSGWEGPFCKEEKNNCNAGTCSNGGLCQTENGTTFCNCLPGTTGANCEKDGENDCAEVTCSHHGKCEDKIRDFKCTCDAGFTGPFCEMAIRNSVAMVTIPPVSRLLALTLGAVAFPSVAMPAS
uniref:EGF-like domain-containing protein n=1 Tax=Trichuris muris TaxID=70415 RepID=A0A5S6R3G3_TRIMR